MSETTYSVDRDLKEAAAMASGLETYVRGTNLYGSVGGGLFSSNMPSLTIGALLMRLRRLRAQFDSLTPDQRSRLEQAEAAHEKARREWTHHYTEKLTQEGFSRLKAMNTFFEECGERALDRPNPCASIYLPEALRRTIVQEILIAMHDSNLPTDALSAEARKIDGRLRRYTAPSDFIWAAELEAIYPRSPYWWLYAKPPVTVKQG